MKELSKTKANNLDRAIRQFKRGFEILADNKCSVFNNGDSLFIFETPDIPRDSSGAVDQDQAYDSVDASCLMDCGDF